MPSFVRRTLKYCPEKLRRLSYISLIRSKLEYYSSVWDPHLLKDIHQLEMVQRRAARFIKRDYRYDSSVGPYHKRLKTSTYRPCKTEEKCIHLTLLYKMRNNLLCVKEKLKELTHALVTPAGTTAKTYLITRFSSTLPTFGIIYQV